MYGFLLRFGSKMVSKEVYEMIADSLALGAEHGACLNMFQWKACNVENEENAETPLATIQLTRGRPILPAIATVTRILRRAECECGLSWRS